MRTNTVILHVVDVTFVVVVAKLGHCSPCADAITILASFRSAPVLRCTVVVSVDSSPEIPHRFRIAYDSGVSVGLIILVEILGTSR